MTGFRSVRQRVAGCLAVGCLLLSGCSSDSTDILGEWTGVLSARGTELTLVLHVARDGNGKLAATLDSQNQGAKGIAVSSIAQDGQRVVFASTSIKAIYEGDLQADGASIKGTWTQGEGAAPLVFRRAQVAHQAGSDAAAPSEIDGGWNGMLRTAQGPLAVIIRIKNTRDGLTAALDSVDQGVTDIRATRVVRAEQSVRMEFAGIGATFEGTLNEQLTALDGTWIQNGRLPFSLTRSP